jgi:hypothetical protein
MEQDSILFPIENILDDETLYYRIHQINIDSSELDERKRILPGAFDPQPKPHGTEMSVDWSKYATAENTKNRARKPEKNGVLSFNSTLVRAVPTPLDVKHQPTHNQAHSVIFDVLPDSNDPEIRIKLRRICEWEIKI